MLKSKKSIKKEKLVWRITASLFLLILVIAACVPENENSIKIDPLATSTVDISETPTTMRPITTKTGPIATAQASVSQAAFSTQQASEPFPDSWVPWLEENSYALHSIKDEDFSDLSFLIPILENRRIVQLGENRHNTSEYSTAKIRLIKFCMKN